MEGDGSCEDENSGIGQGADPEHGEAVGHSHEEVVERVLALSEKFLALVVTKIIHKTLKIAVVRLFVTLKP